MPHCLWARWHWVRLLWARCRIRFKVATPATHFQNIHGKAGVLSLGKNSWKSSQIVSTLLNCPGGRIYQPFENSLQLEASLVFSKWIQASDLSTINNNKVLTQYIPQPALRGHTMAEKAVVLDLTIPSLGALQTLASPFTCHSFPYSASSLSFWMVLTFHFSVWTSMTLSVCVG